MLNIIYYIYHSIDHGRANREYIELIKILDFVFILLTAIVNIRFNNSYIIQNIFH